MADNAQYYSASKKTQFMAAFAATMGAFALGTVLAWPSFATDSLIEDSPDDFGDLTQGNKNLIGSFVALGALVAGPPTGFLIGKLGRKKTMLLLSPPLVGGWMLLAFAQNLAMVLVGRVITGFFAGAFSLVAPVYIGEIADSSVRGLLGSGFQLMVVLGIEFAYVVGGYTTYKWLSISSAAFPVICFVLMIFMAESPRWFITVGRREEAGKALAWFRGTDSVSNVQQELRDLEVSVAEAQSQTVEFKDLLHPSLLKPTLVSLMLMLFQQLSGVNAVIFYLKEIFQESGSDMDPHLSSSIVGGVQIVATLAGALLVDRLGRRILLVISDVGMTLSLVALGAFFSIATEDRDSIGWLPLVSLMVFISAFSIGFGPIPWMILGEILPPRAKGLASAIATSFNWTLAFLVGQFFADIKEGLGINWCYFSFAIVCVVGTIYILTIVPETKGKSLDEIQALFGPPAPSNVVGKDNRSYEEDK